MAVQLDFGDAIPHLFQYAFSTVNKHFAEQSATKHTPYAMYMKDQHEKLKEEIPDISKRSQTIAEKWHDVSDKVKKDYIQKAKDFVPEKDEKKKRKGGLNNFQIFCKLQRDKTPVGKDGKKQSTRELSQIWKDISEDEKEKYKEAAVEYNENHDSYEELAKRFGKSQKNSNKKKKGSKKDKKSSKKD